MASDGVGSCDGAMPILPFRARNGTAPLITEKARRWTSPAYNGPRHPPFCGVDGYVRKRTPLAVRQITITRLGTDGPGQSLGWRRRGRRWDFSTRSWAGPRKRQGTLRATRACVARAARRNERARPRRSSSTPSRRPRSRPRRSRTSSAKPRSRGRAWVRGHAWLELDQDDHHGDQEADHYPDL